LVKITEIVPKILKVFYDQFRETPHGHISRNSIFKEIENEIDEKNFDAAIEYMGAKGMVVLSKFISGWFGRITPYGIEIIEME